MRLDDILYSRGFGPPPHHRGHQRSIAFPQVDTEPMTGIERAFSAWEVFLGPNACGFPLVDELRATTDCSPNQAD